jgi:hypothetical protein
LRPPNLGRVCRNPLTWLQCPGAVNRARRAIGAAAAATGYLALCIAEEIFEGDLRAAPGLLRESEE